MPTRADLPPMRAPKAIPAGGGVVGEVVCVRDYASEQSMEACHDEDAHALYVRLASGEHSHTVVVAEGFVMVDMSTDGRVLGVEVLGVPPMLDAGGTR